jgi:hypothetical protein
MSENRGPDDKQPLEIEPKWAEKTRVPFNYYGQQIALGRIWIMLIILAIALIATYCDPILSRKF